MMSCRRRLAILMISTSPAAFSCAGEFSSRSLPLARIVSFLFSRTQTTSRIPPSNVDSPSARRARAISSWLIRLFNDLTGREDVTADSGFSSLRRMETQPRDQRRPRPILRLLAPGSCPNAPRSLRSSPGAPPSVQRAPCRS